MRGQIFQQGLVQEVLGIPMESVATQLHHPTGPFGCGFQVIHRLDPVVHTILKRRVGFNRSPKRIEFVGVTAIHRLNIHLGQIGNAGWKTAPFGRFANQTALVGIHVISLATAHRPEKVLLGGLGTGVLVVHSFQFLVGQRIGRQR